MTGHNEPWRNTGSDTASQQILPTHMANTADRNDLFSNSPNSPNNRNGPTCFRCGEQGHMRNECTNRVFCSNCRSGNYCNRTCRKLRNNTPSPINSNILKGYHPTATPPPLNDQNPAAPTTGTVNNGLWFHELNQPRSSTTVHTPPANNMSPAQVANMTEAFTQILSQVVTNNKGDGTIQMMKNIKTFDGTNKAECITWLSQTEAASKFSSLSFRELPCQGHVFQQLPQIKRSRM